MELPTLSASIHSGWEMETRCRSLRLFGVQLETSGGGGGGGAAMKKCFSTEYLGFVPPSSSPSPSPPSSLLSIDESSEKVSIGYLSDGLVASRTQERRKGVPWTEEEHKLFLAGLEKLGKGDWRGISRRFVTTRTPTQVASHAQKYFLRQNSLNKKKRRSSLFDVVSSCEIAAQVDAPLLSFSAHTSSDQEQETQLLLPSCVDRMQSCTLSTSVQPCPVDLDLSISTSGAKRNHEASSGLPVFEII